jgi:hypothetical protein
LREELTPAQQLGRMIKQARRARRVGTSSATQAWLGDQCTPRRTPQQISKFESGEAVPADIGALAEIYHILHERDGDATDIAQRFLPWIAVWLSAGRRGSSTEEVQRLLTEAFAVLTSSADGRRINARRKPLSSLADFPGNDPLTIIMGDRREPRVTSAADCLIYSGSVTDAMFLPHMWQGLEGATIRSDKLLVRMPQEYLEEQVPEISERNLLIIGSPAANWGARILNKGAIFPFRIDPDVVRQSEALLNDDRMQDEDFAHEFWTLAQAADETGVHLDEDELSRLGDDDRQQREGAAELVRTVLGGSTAKAVMNRFRTFGVLDPADQENHGTFFHSANDFAVVTIARNPYSKTGRHRTVICAGIHGPGTAAALRELLTNPETFKARTLGAVLEVRLRTDLAWSERFDRAKVSPQTREYAPKAVLENVERALTAPPDSRKNVYQWWDRAALEEVALLIREILQDTNAHDTAE